MSGWLHEGQHAIRPGYACKGQVIMVCQNIMDSTDKGARTVTIIIDFSKAFDLVPNNRLLTKIVAYVCG